MHDERSLMELERTSLGGAPDPKGESVSRLARSRASTGTARHAIESRAPALFIAAEFLIVLAVGVAAYGVAADHEILSVIGLAAIALTALSIALGARASMRGLERRCEVLGRARAESERGRHELEVVNAELERRNSDLEAERAAVVDGFDWIDEQTAGRLRDLLEAAGIELADLADMVLDDSDEDV